MNRGKKEESEDLKNSKGKTIFSSNEEKYISHEDNTLSNKRSYIYVSSVFWGKTTSSLFTLYIYRFAFDSMII